ncbi:hypothetical protein LIER_28661 [Lithospermum erythrorhizon]|uniref:Uncharacterized protein n=1 Tax=Lithospermum erythrorhizon TaxID=34254 RepID=A0AAV3RJW5_LITER
MTIPQKLSEDNPAKNNDVPIYENRHDAENRKEDFQSVDTTNIFTTNSTFDDKESLVTWVKDLGMKNHIYLIIDGSQSSQKYKQPLVGIVCERSGFPRRTESATPEQRKRNRASKKIGCRFRLIGKETVSVGGR